MKKNYVTFYSPGTFASETTVKEVDGWETPQAVEMSKEIIERHGAMPYGFQFTTRERKEDDFDSKETKRSNMYYLGGTVETLEEVKAKNNPDDEVLISNMECNKWKKVITNCNSYRSTFPFNEGDIVLNI